MKKQFLTLSIIAALTACSSDDDKNATTEATPAQLSGDFAGVATKADYSASGRVLISDANDGEALIYPNTLEGSYGTFSINAAGDWEYKLDKTNEMVIALVSSDMPSLQESAFSFKTADGTTSSVAISVDGIDVPATFSGALKFNVIYDDGSASGTVKVQDANPAEALFSPTQTLEAMYGDVTFDTDTGTWTYTLDQTQADAIALNYQGELDDADVPSLEDTFTIKSLDGTEQVVTITVKGSQLVPAVIEGLPEVDENGISAVAVNVNSIDAAGALTIVDPNFGQAKFQVQEEVATAYGTFNIDEMGAWTYQLDNTNAEVVALKGDGTAPTPLSESIKVMAIDGTAVDIPVTINGLVGGNLAAQINGDASDGSFVINTPVDAHTSGKATFRVQYPESASKDARIIFHGKTYKGAGEPQRTMANIILKSNGTIRMFNGTGASSNSNAFELEQTHVKGQWFDLAFTWDATQAVRDANGGYPEVSLSIDGQQITSAGGEVSGMPFPAFAISSSILNQGSKFIGFETKNGSGGPLYVDDIKIYSDVSGTTEVFTENFDTLNEGAEISVDYTNDSKTKQVVIGPIAP
ncbi:VCBS domain-containing protein [Catenovulum agarivorans]|uniref:VCBS domain-containing protein n=1 Tax=Catenovulum agarivorans TaxID=1172192 RepID=UPI0002DC3AFA|nr:VCBS domain-containing protein [Catenovulum agarivorans]